MLENFRTGDCPVLVSSKVLNEGVDEWNDEHEEKREFFTEKQVGRIISELGAQNVAQTMNKTVIDSTKSDEKNG